MQEVDIETTTPWTTALDRQSKQRAALISAIAVIVLGFAKLTLGLATGSLGLIADAAHSGLDLVSSILTYLAVRWADRPADADHPYGHGRVENLAGFVESLIILATAVVIGVEAIQHILGGAAEIVPSPLAFVVLLVSIGVSAWRARTLRRLARLHGSDALAADALNFSADVWSSFVVLIGLALAVAGRLLGQPALATTADAAAGLIVALLVIVAAGRLARETIDALLDRSPRDVAHRIAEVVAQVRGIVEVRRVRVRRVGGQYFVDVIAVAARTTTFEEAHRITEEIERAIWAIEPHSDVVVHLEPAPTSQETIVDRIYLIAQELGVRVHDVQVQQVDDRYDVNLHVEVSPELTLEQAHALATRLEEMISTRNPQVRSVNTHLEIAPSLGTARSDVTATETRLVRRIQAVAAEVLGPGRCRAVRLYRAARRQGELDVVLQCTFAPTTSVTEAHLQAERLERVLRERFPMLGSVLVHVEPGEPGREAGEPLPPRDAH